MTIDCVADRRFGKAVRWDAGTYTVAAEVPRQFSSRAENADGEGASGKRQPRRRNRSSADGDSTPIEYRHDAAKFGNPLRTWTVTDKCIWMLYALKHDAGHKEVSPSQLVGVYNEHFKNAGKLHPPNVTRELAKAKIQNPSAVGEDKGLWLLTDQCERVASGVGSKPAMRGRFKTGHMDGPGRDPFYPALPSSGNSVLVLQLRGPHLRMCPWWSRRSSMAVTAALSPSSLPQSSTGRLEVKSVLARS